MNDVDTSFLDFIPRLQLDLDWDLFPEINQPPPQRETQNSPAAFTEPAFDMPELPVSNPPRNNPASDNRSESAIIPETVIQFIPREEDLADEIDESDSHLPRWDMLN